MYLIVLPTNIFCLVLSSHWICNSAWSGSTDSKKCTSPPLAHRQLKANALEILPSRAAQWVWGVQLSSIKVQALMTFYDTTFVLTRWQSKFCSWGITNKGRSKHTQTAQKWKRLDFASAPQISSAKMHKSVRAQVLANATTSLMRWLYCFTKPNITWNITISIHKLPCKGLWVPCYRHEGPCSN